MPGEAFHSPEPGWFRLCHPLDPAVVAEAVARLATLPGPLTGRPAGTDPVVSAPGPLDRWYESAGVRTGVRRMFHEGAEQGLVFFPEALVPHLAHEAVRALPPSGGAS